MSEDQGSPGNAFKYMNVLADLLRISFLQKKNRNNKLGTRNQSLEYKLQLMKIKYNITCGLL